MTKDLPDLGEPVQYDPEFKGPVKNRSCTDVLCLLLFLGFLIGWGIVAGFAAKEGDPSRLLNPTDSEGRVCGVDTEVLDKPYLFFFDLTRCATPKVLAMGCPTPQVCVKKCPSSNWFYSGALTESAEAAKKKLLCKNRYENSTLPVDQLIKNGYCAYYYLESEELAGRCIPKVVSETAMKVTNVNITTNQLIKNQDGVIITGEMLEKATKQLSEFYKASEVAEGVFQDVKSTWWVLLVGFGLAMIISFIWIVLLRFISAVMIWFSLIAFVVLASYGSYYTLNKYLTIKEATNSTMEMTMSEIAFTTNFNQIVELKTTWLILFIITITLLIVCLLILIFLRKRISIAIALIGEASKAVASIMSTLLFPIIPYILQLVFLIFFCAVALFLASAGRPEYRISCSLSSGCTPCSNPSIYENATCLYNKTDLSSCSEFVCQFFDYHVDPNIPRLHIYNVFALFWSMFFISAFGEMVLAGAFSSWYWAFDKSKDVPTFAVTYSFGRTIRYHIGTLAFGSLIIAIVRMVRVILEYIDHKVRQNSDSKVVRCILCCFKCCLWCLEKFLKFVNRNAYVYCAIYGNNFCTSARKAFSLILRNIARVVVLDKVTDFLLFIGKMVVVGSVGLASFFVFSGEIKQIQGHLPPMNYYLTPVIIITVGTFFITSAFFSVYAMAVDTLFLCFIEDTERNDGSTDRPYYMSKKLMKILDKKNKLKEG